MVKELNIINVLHNIRLIKQSFKQHGRISKSANLKKKKKLYVESDDEIEVKNKEKRETELELVLPVSSNDEY